MSAPGPTRLKAGRFILWGIIALALWNLGRAWVLWEEAGWQTDLGLTLDPRVRLAAAVGWMALFLVAATGFWRRQWWARRLIPLLLAIYGVYELGMTILFASVPPAMLAVVAYVAFAAWAAWVLWRPSAGTHFHSRH